MSRRLFFFIVSSLEFLPALTGSLTPVSAPFLPGSALYVVDLKKFRKIAAGDRLRGQYQALSQDPNSLSNLDQVASQPQRNNNTLFPFDTLA